MKICYIISTCDKYLQTRVKYQMETMLKNVNKEDIYYLTSKPDVENRHFGWYSMDDAPKYNMEIYSFYLSYEYS